MLKQHLPWSGKEQQNVEFVILNKVPSMLQVEDKTWKLCGNEKQQSRGYIGS